MNTSADLALARAGPQLQSDEIAVRLQHLSKRFPGRRPWTTAVRHPFRREYTTGLRDVSCDIRRGEFFGLLGPNGAGKTTLFKILATLISPDGGSAMVEGYDVLQEAARVRKVLTPVIADERSLNWRLSARENLKLFAALHGLDKSMAKSRVDQVLIDVGMSHTGHQIVGTFSSGMKQRLLIARALLSRPRVLLLDEPTRSLDPLSARSFRTFLREEISERQRCTVLLATHNADEAFELCTRVAVLDRGRLLAVGSTRELAESLGDERFRLETSDPGHPSFAALVGQGVISRVTTFETDPNGWTAVELEIPGGPDRSAKTLDFLVCAGVRISRFERITLSLADLIERIVDGRLERA